MPAVATAARAMDRISRRHIVIGSCALAAAGLGRAQARFSAGDLDHALQLREQALTDTEAWALVRELVTDVGARPAGSAGG